MTDTTTPLKLAHVSVSDMENNCYLIFAGTEALLIDAADDAPRLLQLAADHDTRITQVLTTHRHPDHTRALKEILDKTGATHLAPYLEVPALPAPVDVELNHGDEVIVAGHSLPVMILRGHTPGGAAVAAKIEGQTCLFVGDSLFPGGVGKTRAEADFLRLFNDVTTRIFDVYSDDAVVYPGHGATTTLGEERPHLDSWYRRRW